MQESTAKTKICPFMSTSVTPAQSATGTEPVFNEVLCKGSVCLAWQNTEYKSAQAGSNVFNSVSAGWYDTDSTTGTGYCSLTKVNLKN